MRHEKIARRAFLAGGAGAALAPWLPAWAQPVSAGLPTVAGDEIALRIARQTLTMDGRRTKAIGINGHAPAPLIRLTEGRRVRIVVENALDETSSLHWHGLLVPAEQDGVPGISFPGIPAGRRFTYEFDVRQNGTYWYHSHSGLQEQLGLYGPIVIDPAGADPVASDREHVVMLSDHSRLSPEEIFRRMKVAPGAFNFQRQTLGGLLAGRDQRAADRGHWGAMRMDPADVSDATGAVYTYLCNGVGPRDNWTGLFRPGERVRLRIVNASAMTTFNVRAPGLKLSIVQADGQNVVPVSVDELQIGVAETYDAIVVPADRAYTLVGEAVDRSGFARATLAPRAGMIAAVPPLRARPIATMKDMGMGGHGSRPPRAPDPSIERNASAALSADALPAPVVDHVAMEHGATDHAAMGHGAAAAGGAIDHGAMSMRDFRHAPGVAKGPGVQTISPAPVDRTGEPGQGLENVGHRVLTYRDLMALERNPDVRAPSRRIAIHLTGNMERFMWSFDGRNMSEAHEALPFTLGERVRVRLVNDTMMGHPIHLHGHFFELVTGHGERSPRKHTVVVQPGGVVEWDFTADAVGDWAFHCHMLYHMQAGMMRMVSVRPAGAA